MPGQRDARRVVDPQGPVRPGVVLIILATAALATVALWTALGAPGRAGPGDAEARSDVGSAHDAAGGSRHRRGPRRSHLAHHASEGTGGGTSVRLRILPPPNLGRVALLALAEGSDDPRVRAVAIDMLGSTGDPENLEVLLRFADRGAFTVEGYAAQRALMGNYPESWPAEAARRYSELVGEEESRTHEWWPRYGHFSRHRESYAGWGKLNRGWGDRAWDPDNPLYEPIASAVEWRAFLDDYPTFMSADDAAWQLARALSAEHASGSQVVETLDWALTLPDGDAGPLVWAGMRHYLFERATDGEVRSLANRRRLQLPTRYAARYALGVRQVQHLEFEAAAATFADLPDVRFETGNVSNQLRWRDGNVLERWEVCERLAPLERAWRAQRSRSGEPAAVLALASEIIDIDTELGRHVGFFEPWLLVDFDRDHPVATYLGPHLERLRRRTSEPNVRLGLENLMRGLDML